MSLKDMFKTVLSEKEITLMPKRYDLIGHILVISLPKELNLKKKEIAKILIQSQGGVKAVVNKTSKLSGDHRIAIFELLIGNSTLTVHKEFGFSYELDLNEVFFNSRLAAERKRILDQIMPNDNIIVPFCGIGPFAIPAASKGKNVVAIEKNPHAFKFLEKNISLNSVKFNITCFMEDIRNIKYSSIFDRAIIPTPYGMDDSLDIIKPFVKNQGIIHFYTFKPAEQIAELVEIYNKKGFTVTSYRRCGNVAPGISRWVFDMINEEKV